MNHYHIKYFIDAAKLGSISRAADLNAISHSAVSQAIRALESELGLELIKHGRRKFDLTDQGKSSLAQLEELYSHHLRVTANLKNSAEAPSGDLIIWAPQSLVVESLAKDVWRFRQTYPNVRVQLHTGAAFLVRENVQKGQCDLGVLIRDTDTTGLGVAEMAKGEFVLVAKNSNFRLGNQELFVTSLEKIEVRHLFKEWKPSPQVVQSLKTFLVSWGLIKDFVMKGYGIGYVPEYLVKKELDSKKVFRVPMPGKPYRYTLDGVWSESLGLSRNAKLFLELFKETCSKQF